MNEIAVAEELYEEETTEETTEETVRDQRRVVSMEDPFQAFKVITHNCDLDYIKKLGALLDNITKAMS